MGQLEFTISPNWWVSILRSRPFKLMHEDHILWWKSLRSTYLWKVHQIVLIIIILKNIWNDWSTCPRKVQCSCMVSLSRIFRHICSSGFVSRTVLNQTSINVQADERVEIDFWLSLKTISLRWSVWWISSSVLFLDPNVCPTSFTRVRRLYEDRLRRLPRANRKAYYLSLIVFSFDPKFFDIRCWERLSFES